MKRWTANGINKARKEAFFEVTGRANTKQTDGLCKGLTGFEKII
jgi:hypothetical protein